MSTSKEEGDEENDEEEPEDGKDWDPRGLWGVVYSEDGKKTGSRKKK
jgi:hypothetical protein